MLLLVMQQVVAVPAATLYAAVVCFATLLLTYGVAATWSVGVHRRIKEGIAVGAPFRTTMFEVSPACIVTLLRDVHAVFI